MNDRLKTLTYKNYRKTCLCKWVNEAGRVKKFKCSDIVERRHTKIRPFYMTPPPVPHIQAAAGQPDQHIVEVEKEQKNAVTDVSVPAGSNKQ